MSYTCLISLKVETQDTGVTTSTGIRSSVYKSFVLLAKKHYSACLQDDTHVSKGISFVRRSGAELTNAAYTRFINAMHKSRTKEDMVKAVACEYRSLKAQVTSRNRKEPYYMNITRTSMGITETYVSAILIATNKPIDVLRSEYNAHTMVYNTKYYINLLDKVLAKTMVAMNVHDPCYIKSHAMLVH